MVYYQVVNKATGITGDHTDDATLNEKNVPINIKSNTQIANVRHANMECGWEIVR